LTHRAETEFGTLVGDLLADLERFRPGLPAGTTLETIQEALAARAHLRLDELHREYRVDERPDDPDTAAQLQLYHREVEQILLPRYAALSQRQNELERGRSTAWHGPDLYNRATYALIFFAIGLFVVWAPFIPIWDKWIPFAFALVAPLCTPWLPDLYRSLLHYRHQLELELLHQDLDRVGRSLPLPAASLPAPVSASRLVAPSKLPEGLKQKQ
jgi:hypothetical protein